MKKSLFLKLLLISCKIIILCLINGSHFFSPNKIELLPYYELAENFPQLLIAFYERKMEICEGSNNNVEEDWKIWSF